MGQGSRDRLPGAERPLRDGGREGGVQVGLPAWLGEEEASEQQLLALLKPYAAGSVRLWPVSRDVGNVRNDRPDLMEPLAQGALV